MPQQPLLSVNSLAKAWRTTESCMGPTASAEATSDDASSGSTVPLVASIAEDKAVSVAVMPKAFAVGRFWEPMLEPGGSA